ncbi:hypothetical protein EV715DRAFT_211863, partial [Schizophyllum commune]
SRGSLRPSRTSPWRNSMRGTVPVKGADMSKTIPDSGIDDPAPAPSSSTVSIGFDERDDDFDKPAVPANVCDASTLAALQVEPITKDQKRSTTDESTGPQPIPVFRSASFGRKDPKTGKDIRTTRRIRAGRRAPTYAEVGLPANAGRPPMMTTASSQLPLHQVPPSPVTMPRLPLYPNSDNDSTPPEFMAPPNARVGGYPPGYLPGHSRFIYAQQDPSVHPFYGGIQQAPEAQLNHYFGRQAHPLPVHSCARAEVIPVWRDYYGRLDFAPTEPRAMFEQAPELSYTRQQVGHAQQQWDRSSGVVPVIGQAALTSSPPEETSKHYEIYPSTANMPSDKPAQPPVKTARPSLAPAFVPTVKRTSGRARSSTVKQNLSVKRNPSVEVDLIEAAFLSQENTVLGNSVEKVLARLDLEAAEETTKTPVVARDRRCCVFAGKDGIFAGEGGVCAGEVIQAEGARRAT